MVRKSVALPLILLPSFSAISAEKSHKQNRVYPYEIILPKRDDRLFGVQLDNHMLLNLIVKVILNGNSDYCCSEVFLILVKP